jgi:hypothetical protein
MHNVAESIQVEIGDIVIAMPFEVDMQPIVWAVVVNAHNDGSIPGAFHSRFFKLLPVDAF